MSDDARTLEFSYTAAIAQRDRYREKVDALAAEVEEMRATITEQHAKLWLVGLDTHPDEEQQPVERSVRNLRRLLADDAGAAE